MEESFKKLKEMLQKSTNISLSRLFETHADLSGCMWIWNRGSVVARGGRNGEEYCIRQSSAESDRT